MTNREKSSQRARASRTMAPSVLQRIKNLPRVVGAGEVRLKFERAFERLACPGAVQDKRLSRAKVIKVDRVVRLPRYRGLERPHGLRTPALLVVQPAERVVHLVGARHRGL